MGFLRVSPSSAPQLAHDIPPIPATRSLADRSLNRRSFLAAGTALTGSLLFAGGATAASQAAPVRRAQLVPQRAEGSSRATSWPTPPTGSSLVVTDLEIVTLTPTSVTFSWTTRTGLQTSDDTVPPLHAADTEVRLAPALHRGTLPSIYHDPTPRGVHLITIRGLTPNTRYRFECRSQNIVASPSLITTNRVNEPTATGQFTTLTQPPGDYVTTVAFINDTHIGETPQGLILGVYPPPIQQLPGRDPYPTVMLRETLRELRNQGIRHLFINGDCTSEARPAEVAAFRGLLKAFGTYQRHWFVTRGNHDRPHTPSSDPTAHYEDFPVLAGTKNHRDPWGMAFVPRQKMWETRIGNLRVIGLDSTRLDAPNGEIGLSQFTQLRRTLANDPNMPTIVMCHHPVTRESALTNVAGPSFILNKKDRDTLQNILATTPGAFLMVSGHTHRAKRVAPDQAQNVDFLETASTKDYPCGYTLVHLYTGGYTVNFHRTSSPGALEWTSRSRWSVNGLSATVLLGSTADRNYTRQCDLSRLAH